LLSSRANADQIPTEFNDEQTTRVVRKQERVPGERRDKTITDFGKVADVGQVLKDLHFPVSKQEILNFIINSHLPQSRQILADIQQIEDNNRMYQNAFEVAKAAKLVR
jgi:hypothetical protein